MAGNIVIGSKFKPFTYQELLTPVLMADTEHKAIEEKTSELDAKAGVWEKLANETKDQQSYNTYKRYSEDLSRAASDLATKGLQPNSRGALNTLKTKYSNEIVPIELAYNKRDALTKEQRQLQAQDDSIRFTNYAQDLSLDTLIKNPELSYESIKGSTLYKQAYDQAKAASARRVLPDTTTKALNNQYFKLTTELGYSSKDAIKFLANSDSFPELKSLVDNVKVSAGLDRFNNIDQEMLNQQIMNGVVGGLVYDKKTNYMQDSMAIYNMKQASSAKVKAPDRDSYIKIGARDIGVGAKDKEIVKAVVNDTAKKLGLSDSFSKSDGIDRTLIKKIVYSKPKYSRDTPYPHELPIHTKSGSSKIHLFTGDGSLMSKDAFINQGRDSSDIKALGEYYDAQIKTITDKNIDIDGDVLNNISKELSTELNQSGAYKIKQLQIGVNNADNVFKENILPKIIDKDNNLSIQKVTGYNKQGEPTLSNKTIKIDDISNNEGLKASPLFYVSGTPSKDPSKYGIITSIKGEDYFIPHNKFGDTMLEAINAFQEYNEMAQAYEYNTHINGYINSEQQQQDFISINKKSTEAMILINGALTGHSVKYSPSETNPTTTKAVK